MRFWKHAPAHRPITAFRLPVMLAGLMLAAALSFVSASAQAPGAQTQDGPAGQRGPEIAGGTRVMGTVTATAPDSLTVKTMEGEIWQVKTGPNTRVVHEREPGKLSDVQVGFGIMAFGQVDPAHPKDLHAMIAAYSTADEVKKRMEGFGKEWIAGKIVKIDDAKITIARQDGVQQTIEADENTSIKKGRDSVTLADLHPGDPVYARGSMKNGIFVPQQLSVRDSTSIRPRGGSVRAPGAGPGSGSPDSPAAASPSTAPPTAP